MIARANIIDRAIAWVAPRAALGRARARFGLAMSGQYDSGSQRGSLASFNPRVGGPRNDALGSLGKIRSRSRDLVRNNPLASGTLGTFATNVVGHGIFPMARPGQSRLKLTPDKAADHALALGEEFDAWADTTAADVTDVQDFWGLQDLVLRSTLESGDVFTLPRYLSRPGTPYELAIQVIEADRCCNPNNRPDGTKLPNGNELVAGLELDAYGRAAAYWFTDRHPGESLASGLRWERVAAYGNRSGRRMVHHHFRRKRPGQVRGVPMFSAVVQLFKDLGRYTEAEIVAAVLTACFTMSTTTEDGDGADLSGDDGDGSGEGADRLRFVDPGLIANLGPNEAISSINPNRPNQAFDPFVLAMLRQIGVALELPYEVLIKHFTASYSAARAALLEAWKTFRTLRAWLAGSFCQPYYERWLIEAAALGRLPDMPGLFVDDGLFRAWATAEWIGPSPGQIDELKEAQAAKLRVEEEFSTRDEETARLTGGDWRQKHRQRVVEEDLRRQDQTVPAAPPAFPPNAVREDPETPDQPEQQDAA